MSFHATDTVEITAPPSKNRVWDFLTTSATCAGFFESQPVETASETTVTVTTTVSGVVDWLSNDPIGISGGLNQYCFCGDDPVNKRDPSGRCSDDEKPRRPPTTAEVLMNFANPISSPGPSSVDDVSTTVLGIIDVGGGMYVGPSMTHMPPDIENEFGHTVYGVGIGGHF